MIIEYIVTVSIYYLGLVFAFSPALALLNYMNEAPAGSLVHQLSIGLMFPVMAVYLLGIPYLAHQLAKRKVFEGMTFRESSSDTLAHIRLCLAFVPVVGGCFRPKAEQSGFEYKNDDTSDRAGKKP